MDQPLVTVFIPLYNSESYIKETLSSVINQTYRNLEILIIDDGSTDKSVEIVEKIVDSRIRLLKNGKNMGIPYTRNRGIVEATGKYIANLDADDISLPTRIEKQVNYLEKNKEIDVLASNYKIYNGKRMKKVKSDTLNNEEIKIGLIFANRICNSTAMFRKETINKNKLLYHSNFFVAQDYEFFSQISKIGQIKILPQYLVVYRTGHLNITKKSKANYNKERKKIIDKIHLDLLEFYGFELSKEEKVEFCDFFSNEYSRKFDSYSTEKLTLLFEKLIIENNRNKIFDHPKFMNVLNNSIFDYINRHKINYVDKFKLLKWMGFEKNKSKIFKLVLMHLSQLLREIHK